MRQNVLKIKGPKEDLKDRTKGKSETESARKADSTLGTGNNFFPTGKAESAFLWVEQKPTPLFVLIRPVFTFSLN